MIASGGKALNCVGNRLFIMRPQWFAGQCSIPVSNLNKCCICATGTLCVFIPNRTAAEPYNNKDNKLSLLCEERSPEASTTPLVMLVFICLN